MSGYIGPIPVPQGIQNKETFTATAGQTTFGTKGYTDGAFINVYLNGVRLINGTDYTATNGSDVVLTTGASADDVLDFETFSQFQLVSSTQTTPTFKTSATLKNDTHEDTDGGRESTLIFQGEQSGGEITTLAEVEASHDGTADDQKGDLIFRTNDGSDGTSPTERMRIDSVGTMTVTSTDQGIATFAHASTSTAALNGGAQINIKNTDNTNGNQSSIVFRDSAGNASSAIFGFNTDHSDGEGFMKFGCRDDSGTFAERVRIDHHGIKLNGDTAEDNALSDYEEGTFTATLVGYHSNPSSAVTTTGYYTKIGNMVTIFVAFESANTTGASGDMWFTGLPFAHSGPYTIQSCSMNSAGTFPNSSPFGLVSGSVLYFYKHTSNGVPTAVYHNAGTSRAIRVTGEYRTT